VTDVLAGSAAPRAETSPGHGVSVGEGFRVWLRVAALSFGGPAGQIAVMHRIIVEERKWVSDKRFLHALNYCMLLPGPEAQQLATYIGWLMHRTLGGVMAGGLFVLPGVLSIVALSYIYVLFGDVGFVNALFSGLKCAVLAIVVNAVQRIGKRALKNNVLRGIAAAAFVGIFFLNVPFPAIVLGAGAIGFAGGRMGLPQFAVGGCHGSAKDSEVVTNLLGEELPAHANPSIGQSLLAATIWLCVWLLPVIALVVFAGSSVFTSIALFFSKTALVTFGGAYAVFAYVAQQSVGHCHWLRSGEMLDGLGMAETTPGPLIMVLQFVGFLAAFRAPGVLSPLTAGTLGGLLATWVTFTPCFLWIFLGAPFIEQLRGNKALGGALSAITATVAGVILNLAIWFAINVVFRATWRVHGYGLSFDAPDVGERQSLGFGAHHRSHDRRVSVQGRHAANARRLFRCRSHSPRCGGLFMTTTMRGSLGRADMRAITATLILSPVLLWSAAAGAAEPDWTKLDAVFARAATVSGTVHRYGFPRLDLKVSLDGVQLKPGLALGGWLAFEPIGDATMMMGDLVLTEEEINPVMTKLLEGGLQVTAVHNHLLRASPPTFYMHVAGLGDAELLARAARAALEQSKTPLQLGAPSPPTSADLGIDTSAIDKAVGFKGRNNGGVYQFGVPRSDSFKQNGMAIPGAMGSAIVMNFQPTGEGKAAITGDFVALASEVNPLIKALRDNGIEVTAIHNHMLDDDPRAFFVHFWANDDAVKLAKGLRAGLDAVHVGPGG